MRWSLTFLRLALPSTFLSQFTAAHPLDGHAAVNEADFANLTQTLLRRVRVGNGGGEITAPTLTDLFLVNDGAGSCSSKEETINSWLEEAVLLHDAVETAYEYGSPAVALLWYSFFGIQPSEGQIAKTAANVALWNNIGGESEVLHLRLAILYLEVPDLLIRTTRYMQITSPASVSFWPELV